MTESAFPPPAIFQSFETTSDPQNVAKRLEALRAELQKHELDGFLVPRADAHRGESVPPGEARLAYLTGFTGSAGMAIVNREKAALFVDSRYTLQAPAQTDTSLVDVLEVGQGGISEEVAAYVPQGGRIGYDPWLHTPGEIKALEEKLGGKATLVASENLVDKIWPDRPSAPVSEIEFLGRNRAGREASDKISDLQTTLSETGAAATVLSLPESICWLLNIRGRDVPNTPFVLGFAIVPATGRPTLFLDAAKITDALRQRFAELADVRSTEELSSALSQFGESQVQVDPATVPVAITETLRAAGSKLLERRDPVLLPKARKNEVELSGMREAHRLDGTALAKFLSWFDRHAPDGELTEIAIVSALEAFRREEETCIDASFDTISGAGPNGAIVHYRVTDKTNRTLAPGELMLVDSGAQYISGTTDITRTMSTGDTTQQQRDRFTRVLKGMIGISTVRFPKGTTGAQIDILARQHLWQVGLTYNHGTGHGVGHVLSVHEGPTGIAPRYTLPLEAGMVLSNEPGYYETGAYGIRIENLIVVRESKVGSGYLEFETITLAPIDTRLVDVGLLTEDERSWLNAYHQRVLREIGPTVSGDVLDWLEDATRPI
ncbi:aminopeptidase [Devosia pacifica]|uniref:Aminopeptidase n=1 Tax=Devosia pacifica TaxID=1335967 RepID=A0A918RWY8_9HYPH|nr:aminopeptidase P family protein [Devosia pacifica]GHA15812.1 aminopeptidase [Devosia pacifica]